MSLSKVAHSKNGKIIPFLSLSVPGTMQTFCWWSYAKVKSWSSGRTPRKALARNTPSGTQQQGSLLSMTQTMLWGTPSTRDLRSGMFSPHHGSCENYSSVGWLSTHCCRCDSQAKEWILRDRRRRSSSSLRPYWKTRTVRKKLMM